ncbi:MAG: cytochrome c biogenesis CcdA family protein, partial [Gemmatimonadota bacterium]
MSGELSFAVAFAAGVVSFLSPCVLPLFPSYLSFITGLTFDELAEPGPEARGRVRRLTIVHSLMFILG